MHGKVYTEKLIESQKGESSPSNSRERDPIPNLPLPPRPRLGSQPSKRETDEWKIEMRLWEKRVDLLLILKQLHGGRLKEEEFIGWSNGRKELDPGVEKLRFPVSWKDSSATWITSLGEKIDKGNHVSFQQFYSPCEHDLKKWQNRH